MRSNRVIFAVLIISIMALALVCFSTPEATASGGAPTFTLYNPFNKTGNNTYYFGGHVHTSASDGYASASTLVNYFKTNSFSACSICDHWGITQNPGIAGITYIPGTEWSSQSISFPHGDLCLYSTEMPYGTYQAERRYGTSTNYYRNFTEVRLYQKKYNATLSFNHPESSQSWTAAEMGLSQDYDLYEVCQGGPPYISGRIANTSAKYDPQVHAGKKVWLTSDTDTHGMTVQPCWDVVAAPDNGNVSIMNSIHYGNFYACAGPQNGTPSALITNIVADATGVTLTLYKTGKVTWIGNNGSTLSITNGATSRYDINGTEHYVRAYIDFDNGFRLAWTQPIFIIPRKAYDVTGVSHTIPSTMVHGTTATVDVTFKNGGNGQWNRTATYVYGAGDAHFFGYTKFVLAGAVDTEGSITIRFNIKAPSTPGTYKVRYVPRYRDNFNIGEGITQTITVT